MNGMKQENLVVNKIYVYFNMEYLCTLKYTV